MSKQLLRSTGPQDLRHAIDGLEVVETIKALLVEVEDLKVSTSKVVNTRKAPTAVRDARIKAASTLRIIEIQLKANFQLLLKVLPDLRNADAKPASGDDYLDQLKQAMLGVTRERVAAASAKTTQH